MAQRAIELLDTDGDSAIDLSEVKAAPGLAASFGPIDTSRDGKLSYEEIYERIAFHEHAGTGLCGESYTVRLNRQPLRGARIDFVPEAFLGGEIEPASGITDEYGEVAPQTIGQSVRGLRAGFYRLEVFPDGADGTQPMSLKDDVGIEVKAFSDDADTSSILDLRT